MVERCGLRRRVAFGDFRRRAGKEDARFGTGGGHYRTCCDDGLFGQGNAWQNEGSRAEPATIANGD